MEAFGEEITLLTKGKDLPKKSQLRQLLPILDTEGILRKNEITRLLVKDRHRFGGHFRGTNAVLADLRQKYWVIDGREEVKRCKINCKLCHTRKELGINQKVAPLPRSRLLVSLRCFFSCAVDYGGPFTTKITRRCTAKRYLCLFTCMATRAVHLEMAYSLDTAGFLLAFSRMVARRGKPSVMTSDNGTNFTAGEKELRQLVQMLDKDEIKMKGASQGIKWKFNPPAAPHHGGVFESMIKQAKKAVKSILGNAKLTDEELLSAIVETEGLLNSRPLTYVSDDPDDEEVLTPNHFIHGQVGGNLAQSITDEVAFNPRNRWRYVQSLVKKVWRRWSSEYLTPLNTFPKWVRVRQNLKVNDIVMLKDEENPRGRWPLAKVVGVYPGEDELVRVARVRCRGKEYVRAVNKLCHLNCDRDYV
ncbi:uncharacterized protein LOC141900828 [Tubulanus polymorphus]|uniref:uncharacterized protein LOC141900828 n=1 Tax=Tubulanus polymorphus TaxID=672921 RepID=UPI003DA2B977